MTIARDLHARWVHGPRVRRLAASFAELIPSRCRLLDVGCGDGLLGNQIRELRPDVQVEGIELLVRDETSIPVSQFDGLSIPFEDGRFDLALFVDVLHHAGEPKELIREAARVAGGRILIKDHLLEGFLAGPTLQFMDWVGNAGRGFVLPEGYWPREQWRAAFDDLGLEIDVWASNIELYPAPLDLVFGRSLHFIARLHRAEKTSGAGQRLK